MQVCEYPHSSSARVRLGKCVWQVIIAEIEERKLDMDEEDLLEVLHAFGCHITNRAFAERPGNKMDLAKATRQGEEEAMEE